MLPANGNVFSVRETRFPLEGNFLPPLGNLLSTKGNLLSTKGNLLSPRETSRGQRYFLLICQFPSWACTQHASDNPLFSDRSAGRKINAREMVQINDFFEISYRSTVAIAHESAKAPRARSPRMNFSVLTYCTPKKVVRGNRCRVFVFRLVKKI